MLSLTGRAAGFGLTEWLKNQLVSCLDAGFPHAPSLLQNKFNQVDPSLQTCTLTHLFRILNPDNTPSSALPSLGIPGEVIIILMKLPPSVGSVAKQSFWWINHFSEGIFCFPLSQNSSEKVSCNGISAAERRYWDTDTITSFVPAFKN